MMTGFLLGVVATLVAEGALLWGCAYLQEQRDVRDQETLRRARRRGDV